MHGEAFKDFRNDERCRHGGFSLPALIFCEKREALFGIARLDLQNGGNKQLRVGLAGVVQHPVGQTVLNDIAALHHHHAMGKKPRNREVMRDDDNGKAEIVDEATNQIEQTRLHRNIETTCRLIHEDKARRGDKVAGDLEALAHAAREGARLVVDTVGADFHPLQPFAGRLTDIAVMPVAHGHQPLANIRASRHRHAQPICGVLVHETPVGPHQETPFGFSHVVKVTHGAVAHAIFHAACRWHQPGRNAVEKGRLA
ncbi:hypothetical protein AT6N2_C2404 [Agrobacterium tumefaciens]|nr:hypothetical protein AT6N2_C2404 [Agrobacterium tumefaciens]